MKRQREQMVRRGRGLLLAAGVVLSVILIRAWYFAGPCRAEALAAGERMARLEAAIPAVRGRILDASGVVLAWSERRFDLLVSPDFNDDAALTALLPPGPERSTGVWRRSLSGEELLLLESWVKERRQLRIVSRLERIVINSPRWRGRIGGCVVNNGVLEGISGLELEYDKLLRGTPGVFQVMLDPHRRWIESSWTLLSPPVNGKDVRLPEAIAGDLNR